VARAPRKPKLPPLDFDREDFFNFAWHGFKELRRDLSSAAKMKPGGEWHFNDGEDSGRVAMRLEWAEAWRIRLIKLIDYAHARGLMAWAGEDQLRRWNEDEDRREAEAQAEAAAESAISG
jgi:hypothetical protein